MSAALMFVRDGRTLPFIPVTAAALTAVRDGQPKNLAITRSLYMALLECANEDRADRTAVSQRELVERSGASRGSVQTALKDLVTAAVVRIVERADARGRVENEYVLVDPPLPAPGPAGVQNSAPPAHQVCGPAQEVCTPRTPGVQLTPEEGKREREDARESDENSPVAVLCDRLAALRSAYDPEAQTLARSRRWREAAEQLLVERGGKLAELLELIAWLPADPWWAARVLEPADLRKHVVRLLAVRQAARDGPRPSTPAGRDVAARRERAAARAAVAGACCAGDSPPTHAETEWAAAAPKIRAALGRDMWEVWMGGAHAHTGEHGQLLIAVPEPVYEWVSDRFQRPLTDAVGRPVEVVICQEAITQ